MTTRLFFKGKARMGWKRGRVAQDAEGRLWLVKGLRFVPGAGVRVWLSRPRADTFSSLVDAARTHVVVGELVQQRALRASVTG